MFENQGDSQNDNSVSSPDTSAKNERIEDVGSKANEPAMDIREFLSKRADLRDKQSRADEGTKEDTDSVAADDVEASDQTDDSRPSKTDKVDSKENSKFQSRIDKLTARYHSEARESAKKDVELQKLHKATELLQREVERLSKGRQFDPNEERIKELEYTREIDEFTRGLSDMEAKTYEKRMQQTSIANRAEEILESVNSACEEYYLVSPEEVMIHMRNSEQNLSVTAAARQLHMARLQKVQQRTGAKHPSSVSKQGNSSLSDPSKPYEGSKTIRDFLLRKEAERRGRAD